MADGKTFASNANDALQIRLRGKGAHAPDVTFNPAFTYPIFGEEETIFGYQGLKIRLNFTSDTLKPNLNISTSATFSSEVDDTKPDDIQGALKEFLPGLNVDSPMKDPEEDGTFTPPGKLIHQYELGGRKFGIWTTTLSDPKANRLLRNMQILILFFIEGGSCIELDDPDWTMERWRVFFVYSIDISNTSEIPSYSLVGYSTAYTLFFIDQTKSTTLDDTYTLQADDSSILSSLPARSRISQFLILPPYQNSGHGSQLYETTFTFFLNQPNTKEIPVEDPNESFDDLRDTCDLLRLRANNPEFNQLSINTSVILPTRKSEPLPTAQLLPPKLTEPIRIASKIAERQFARLTEMQILSRIPVGNRQVSRLTRRDKASDLNDRAYYFWRLLVKQRLYKHNKESLSQLDLSERLEKLEETLMTVEKDYLRLLDGVDRKARKLADVIVQDEAAGDGKSRGKLASRSLKRKAVGDFDKDDVEAGNENSTPTGNGHAKHKRRIVDDEDED